MGKEGDRLTMLWLVPSGALVGAQVFFDISISVLVALAPSSEGVRDPGLSVFGLAQA